MKPGAEKKDSGPGAVKLLDTYRPLIDGVVFVLGLIGILVVVHLWIQSGRGFDRGCFGFTDPELVTTAVDCEAVTQSDAGMMFGVSNVLWGLAFYVGLTGLSFAVSLVPVGSVGRVKRLRAVAIGAGFLYSLYLVYVQYFQLGQFCRLCLISASIVALLFVVQIVDAYAGRRLKPMKATVPGAGRRAPLFASLLAATVVLAGADVMYFRGIPAGTDSGAAGMARADGVPVEGPGVGECLYDHEMPVVENYRDMVSFSDPSKGNPQGKVVVIEFFDPNCPHCRTMEPMMHEVAARTGDVAWFVWRPHVLWQYSLPQVEALYLAAQESKFFEMLREQFVRQRQGGIPVPELVEIAGSIGMNAELMQARLERGLYRNIVMRQRQHAIEAGVSSVPAVMINGRFVHRTSRTVDCLSTLIESAAG